MGLARMSLVRLAWNPEKAGLLTVYKAPVKITKSTGHREAASPSQNLEILNPLYDLTPSTFITAVVTEVGLIPPSSISSIPLALGKTTL